jgi:hypothetical protein
LPSEKFEDRFQRDPRYAGPVKNIGKDLQEALGASAMDERISSIEITERPLKAIGPGLEHEPLVLLMSAHLDCQSQLEGHVEARHAAARLYPREIMDRDRTSPQQILNPFEPSLWARDLNHSTGPKSERAQPGNGGQIERRVPPVKGNVQKGFRGRSALAQRAWLTRSGRYAALCAARRADLTAVPRPFPAESSSLYFFRNSATSREILRWVAAESLKTLAVSARVGHLLVRCTRRRVMSSRY